MPIKSFYFKQGDMYVLEKFCAICKTEGTSQGTKLMELVGPYVAKHWDGNPQTTLDFAGEIKTLPKYKTCRYSQHLLAGGVFYCFLNQPRYGHSPGLYPPIRCGRCDHYEVDPHDDAQS